MTTQAAATCRPQRSPCRSAPGPSRQRLLQRVCRLCTRRPPRWACRRTPGSALRHCRLRTQISSRRSYIVYRQILLIYLEMDFVICYDYFRRMQNTSPSNPPYTLSVPKKGQPSCAVAKAHYGLRACHSHEARLQGRRAWRAEASWRPLPLGARHRPRRPLAAARSRAGTQVASRCRCLSPRPAAPDTGLFQATNTPSESTNAVLLSYERRKDAVSSTLHLRGLREAFTIYSKKQRGGGVGGAAPSRHALRGAPRTAAGAAAATARPRRRSLRRRP